ncbi:tRNA pseudouridine(55) synthase TruB, partial [Candidatus Similichlamydia epinepheli]|uniref:tRNA pseudouridine(55) synthase TruB n=1 Tax=Candidatus Similichlamydia epinepheli TaxID=1903953 RepID=UPI000D35E05A
MGDQLEGVLPVYKPAGMSSFSVVSRVRKFLSKGTKVGHTGTLDRFAEGVLVILIGRSYTRLSDVFMSHRKVYRAVLELGHETDTLDTAGAPTHFSGHFPEYSELDNALSSFLGEIDHVPPVYSAKKFQGRRLSDWAREGQSVMPRHARIYVYSVELIDYKAPLVEFRIECSKGSYIRSLGRDLARKVLSRGHLVTLVREKNGFFCVDDT